MNRIRSMLRFLAVVPHDGTKPDASASYTITPEAIRALISREGGGDSNEAIRHLLRENHKARRRAKTAEGELEKLKTDNRIAPQGGAVITAEEKKLLDTISPYLTESKLTPEKLIEAAKRTGELEGEIATRDRKAGIASVAEAAGYNVDALVEVVELKKLEVAMRDVTVKEDGKTVKESRPFVRKAGDDKAEWLPLAEYVDESLKPFKPALEATADDDGDTAEGEGRSFRRDTSRRESEGTRFPSQSRSREAPKGGKSEKELREEAASTGMYSTI